MVSQLFTNSSEVTAFLLFELQRAPFKDTVYSPSKRGNNQKCCWEKKLTWRYTTTIVCLWIKLLFLWGLIWNILYTPLCVQLIEASVCVCVLMGGCVLMGVCAVYHALYLEELTAAELIRKMACVCSVPLGQINQVYRQGPTGIHILLSDQVSTYLHIMCEFYLWLGRADVLCPSGVCIIFTYCLCYTMLCPTLTRPPSTHSGSVPFKSLPNTLPITASGVIYPF